MTCIELSNRGLWRIITGRSSLQEPDQIAGELGQKKGRLLEGVKFLKEPNPQSANTLQKFVSGKPKREKFVAKISKFLDLDELQSLQLFGSYLENEFRGSKQQLLGMLKGEAQTEALLLKIMEYYFEERLHILLCVKFLLSYWQDPRHPYRKEFADCVEAMQDKDVLITKMTEQYKVCCSSTVSVQDSSGSSLTKCSRWAQQYLREQILLLEIILLYYKEFVVPAESLLELAKLFQAQGFGRKQVNRHLFEAQSEALLLQISNLQVLVLIISMDLESLRKGIQEDSCSNHHLVQEKDKLEALDEVFVSWGDQPHHGPVMLAWAVLRYVTMDASQEQFVRKIGSKALQCSVFQYLLGLLKSDEMSRSSPVSNTCKSLIYGLMVVVLALFHEDTLGDLQLLVSVISQTLTEKGLCLDFWDSDLSTGAGLLLNSARSWFPLQFSPLLELLRSLAGDEESAAKVYEFLDCVTSYTELLRENRLGDVDCSGDKKIWRIVTPRLLYKPFLGSDPQELVMPTGTTGKVAAIDEGPAIIQWNYRYSCWKLFALEIDSFLESVGSGTALDGQNVICIVDLVKEILLNDWSKAVQLKPIITRLYLIIQRCTVSPHPPLQLIGSCLSCLATAALREPHQVWHHLQQTSFLPRCVSVKFSETDKTKIDFLSPSPGNFGSILSTKERPTGNYPVTTATLNLLLKLIQGISVAKVTNIQPINFLDLAACNLFVMREIFTGFHKWRYVRVKDREEIGLRSLQLFNVVLGLHFEHKNAEDMGDEMELEITDLSRTPTVLQDSLVPCLLFTEAGQSLLNILGTGVDTVDRLVSLGSSSTGGYALTLVELIKLAFSVLNRLLARKEENDEISPLEEALSTQVVHQLKDKAHTFSTSWGHCQLVTVIASYIYHRLDSQLPTLATLLLKRMCVVAPMSMHASFGAEATPLRDAFVSRLTTLTEDVKLKVVVLEFISTAVETQPGLVELFLDLSSKEDKEFVIGENSCLVAVLDFIDPEKQVEHYIPPQLVSAAYLLLFSLWHDRRDAALTAIRKSPNFWENLSHPLLSGIRSELDEDYRYYLEICCYAFQIISLETYYVTRGQIDDGLKTSMKRFCSEQRYHYWGRFLKAPEPGPIDDGMQDQGEEFEDETLKLLKAWRTFLVVSSSFQTEIFGLDESARRKVILEDILQGLKSQVLRLASVKSIKAAGEVCSLFLMLLKRWKSCLQDLNPVFQCLVDVLEAAHKNDTQLFVHIRVTIFSSISVLLQHARCERLSGSLNRIYAMTLLPLACEPLEYLRGKFSGHEKQQDRVLELSVFIIDEILNILLANPGQWLPVLREHVLFASLVQALDVCIKTREKVGFTEAILHLFLSLSRQPMSAEALAMNGLSQPLCLGLATLSNAAEREQQPLQRKPGSQSQSDHFQPQNWSRVWQLALAVMGSMLRTLRHGFLKEALDFAGVHRERLAEAMNAVRRSQSSEVLTEAEEVSAFLLELGHFFNDWRFALPDVLNILQTRIGVLCQSCVALMTHPRLLAHLLELSKGSGCSAALSSKAQSADVSLSLSGSFSREMLRTYSYADDDSFRNSPLVSQTQSQLLKILCNSLAMLRHLTPDICGILIDQGMDLDSFPPLLSLGFSSPTVDHEEPLSFGTLLACLNMALSNLGPPDVKSPVRSPVRTLSESLSRSSLMFTMENALVVTLSQACRYLRDPSLDPRVKQFLKRELGSELGNFLGGLFRHFVRRALPPSPAGSTQTSPSGSMRRTPTKALAFTEAPEQKFFKLADVFVKQVLR
ncbi:nucleoporin NUP188-like isoform X1 [Acropora muricata]|uniref:nucleoporin NUP188-like isoform X1 n=1 Tax=Acropora muricata TaxID=159855 RepID=UPI0034E456B3